MYTFFLLLLVAGVILSPFALDYWLQQARRQSARRRFNVAAARKASRHQTWAAPQFFPAVPLR